MTTRALAQARADAGFLIDLALKRGLTSEDLLLVVPRLVLELADELERERARHAALRAAAEVTHKQIDYLQGLWGKEAITDGLAGRLLDALKLTEAPR